MVGLDEVSCFRERMAEHGQVGASAVSKMVQKCAGRLRMMTSRYNLDWRERVSTAMQVELFGGFSIVSASGEPIVLGARKDQALLAYLLLDRDRGHTRAKLAALLWGARGERQARKSLSQSIYGLRNALRDAAGFRIEARLDQVFLEPGAMSVDVDRFHQALDAGELRRLADTVLAIRGPLLDGFDLKEDAFEDWLRVEREALRQQIVQVCRQLLAEFGARLTEQQIIELGRLTRSISPEDPEPRVEIGSHETRPARHYPRLLVSGGIRPTLTVAGSHSDAPRGAVGPMVKIHNALISALHRSRSVAVKMDSDHGPTDPAAMSDFILSTQVLPAAEGTRLTVRVADANTGTVLFDTETRIVRAPWLDWSAWSARIVGRFESALAGYLGEKAWSSAHSEFDPGEEVFRGFALMDQVTALGRWRAFRRFSKAYSARPDFARALIGAAWCYKRLMQESGNVLSMRSRARALELVRQALQADPKDPFVLAQASGIYLRMRNDPSRAIELLERAVSLHPGWTRIWSASAETHWMLGSPDRAVESAGRALSLVPEDPSFWVPHAALAISEMQRGNYDEAVEWANRCLERNPAYASVHLVRIASEALRGRVEVARSLVRDDWERSSPPSMVQVRSRYQLNRLQNLDKFMRGLELAGFVDE
jgi:tetratricopeptide (TPR) repeat protein